MVRSPVTAMREFVGHAVLPLKVPETDVQTVLVSRLMRLLDCRDERLAAYGSGPRPVSGGQETGAGPRLI